MITTQKTIAVVTSTIGKPSLEKAILSVKAQEYPCKHYVFVDGKQFHHKVKHLEEKYPDVIFTYLPMNTGAGGYTNSFINAVASFLIKEDIICYLDDDNWYDSNHTQAIANAFNRYDIDMAFNLRRFCDKDGNYLCDDNTESLGFWTFDKEIKYVMTYGEKSVTMLVKFNRKNGHIDTNCIAFSKETIQKIAHYWTIGGHTNDHELLQRFFKLKQKSLCTGKRTVNYIFNDTYISVDNVMEYLQAPQEAEYEMKMQSLIKINNAVDDYEKPWLEETLLDNKE